MKINMNERRLICFDSDGCAIDSMTIKHEKAFGPAFVEVFDVPLQMQNEVLKKWNEINLYKMSRGINRFQGFVEILTLYPQFTVAEDLTDMKNWTITTIALSADALRKAYEQSGNGLMEKALEWSNLVNQKISHLPLAMPFEHVKETLSSLKGLADIAVVSSANLSAIEEEWQKSGLYEMVDYFYSQSDGTKSECIKKLLQMGYRADASMMVGDAIGDFYAAEQNNVLFYPILAGKETDSWKYLKEKVLPQFLEGKLSNNSQIIFLNALKENLE